MEPRLLVHIVAKEFREFFLEHAFFLLSQSDDVINSTSFPVVISSNLLSQPVHESQNLSSTWIDLQVLQPAETKFRWTVTRPRSYRSRALAWPASLSTTPLPRRPTTCTRSFFNIQLSFQCAITYLGGCVCRNPAFQNHGTALTNPR